MLFAAFSITNQLYKKREFVKVRKGHNAHSHHATFIRALFGDTARCCLLLHSD